MWFMDCKIAAFVDTGCEVINPAATGVDLVSARIDLVGIKVELAAAGFDLAAAAKVSLADTRVEWVAEKIALFVAKVVDIAAKVALVIAKVFLTTVMVVGQFLDGYPVRIGKFRMEFDHMHQEQQIDQVAHGVLLVEYRVDFAMPETYGR